MSLMHFFILNFARRLKIYSSGISLRFYIKEMHRSFLLFAPRKESIHFRIVLTLHKVSNKHILITYGIKHSVPKVDLLCAFTMLGLATVKRIQAKSSYRADARILSVCVHRGVEDGGEGARCAADPGGQSQRSGKMNILILKNMIFYVQNMLNYWAK